MSADALIEGEFVPKSRHRDWNLMTCARVRRYQREMCLGVGIGQQ